MYLNIIKETPKNPMIGENRQLVTNEPVEVQDCREITDHLWGTYNIPKFSKEKPEDVNRLPVGLANTRISTGYAKNLPNHWKDHMM